MHEDPADPLELRLARFSEGDANVVLAVGELDASSAERLRAAFDEVFGEGKSSVVVDLEGITFIDSSGLSALIYVYKQAREREGSLTLRSPSASVLRILELTGQRDRFLGPAE